MPTNKQRREASRRQLERQLQARQEREARRRRVTLIGSVVGTVAVVLVAVILGVVLSGGGGKKSTAAGGGTSSASATPPTAGTSSAAAPVTPSAPPSSSYPPATGPAVSFKGVTVKGAKDLAGSPTVTSRSAASATKLEVKDLVVGKGKAATPSSSVTVQYTGVLYKNGTKFDSSWDRGQPATFSLTQVVKGFTEGIGGTTGVPPMRVGGRRIMILPAALGYGSTAQGAIPANSSLVFVVDLLKVS